MLAPKRSGMAITSLILGLVSLPAIFLCIGWITSIAAVVLGFIAIGTISKSQGRIDAKETVATIAWMAANEVLSDHAGEAPQGSPLIVGLRGIALYGSIMSGEVGAEEPTDTGADKDVLEAFYLVETPNGGDADE